MSEAGRGHAAGEATEAYRLNGVIMKNVGYSGRLPGFVIYFKHLLPVWTWVSSLISLSLFCHL